MLSYLSPSSISLWMQSEEDFFVRYMTDVPGFPQTSAMAVGSAFDACIKAYLTLWTSCGGEVASADHVALYQEYLADCVEPELIETARVHGIIVFNKFKETGALSNLLNDLQDSACEVLGKVERVVDGVPLLGKPDLSYVSRSQGCKVVDDWKCNGAMSKRAVSPTPGYIDLFPSRDMHKKCDLKNGVNMLDIHESYQIQMVIYKLLTDAEIVGITQLVFGASDVEAGVIGECRVALHRHRVSAELERFVMDRAKELWGYVEAYRESPTDGFGGITATRCAQLVDQAKVMVDPKIRMLFGR